MREKRVDSYYCKVFLVSDYLVRTLLNECDFKDLEKEKMICMALNLRSDAWDKIFKNKGERYDKRS